MENIFEQFTITVLKLNKLIHRIKVCEMEEYGLKAIHVMCGYYLKENPTGLTVSELSALTLEDKAAISRALKTMRDRGYVKTDGAAHNAAVTLTDEGKRLADEISQKALRAVSAGSAFASEEDRTAFYRALQKIADNLSEYYEALKGKDV